jgi:type III secretory pathway component EscR
MESFDTCSSERLRDHEKDESFDYVSYAYFRLGIEFLIVFSIVNALGIAWVMLNLVVAGICLLITVIFVTVVIDVVIDRRKNR